jgi:hypothetical protein
VETLTGVDAWLAFVQRQSDREPTDKEREVTKLVCLALDDCDTEEMAAVLLVLVQKLDDRIKDQEGRDDPAQ